MQFQRTSNNRRTLATSKNIWKSTKLERFEGTGKLTDIQVDLNVEPEFKPVAQPPRRQPFSVRGEMEKGIQHLWKKISLKKLTSQRDGYRRQW